MLIVTETRPVDVEVSMGVLATKISQLFGGDACVPQIDALEHDHELFAAQACTPISLAPERVRDLLGQFLEDKHHPRDARNYR